MKRTLIALLLLLGSCSTTSQSLERLYKDGIRERQEDVFSGLDQSSMEREESRREKVRGYLVEEKLVSAEDYLYAGAILAMSPFEDDLITAQMAGLKAAELGNDRGFRVAAEAIDRHAMHLGRPQRYGTQYYYEEVLKRWRLYPIDPRTSDAEREAMGVPPMAELLAKTEELNERVR